MIVKDEEESLPRCLSSVKDYVDEIVVVDTGSTDRTVEIARRFGAQIYHHPWEDNFSKHRNQSISYATGDWFMYLDADEEIVEGTGPLIREAIQNQKVDSITFEFISLYAGGKKSFHTQQRLFRNDRGIHFEGRIHNRIVGVKTTCLYPIKVLHHGYNVHHEKAKLKHERRIKILKREIEDDPQNPIHHHYLAASYLSVPDYEQAAQEALSAIDLADKRGEAGSFFYAWTHYIAAASLYHLGHLERAQKVCRLGLDRFPDDPDLHFVSCQIAFDQKDGVNLEKHAARYLALHDELTYKPEKRGMIHCVTFDQAWRIWWFMAMNDARGGRQQDYERKLNRAMETAPRRSEVYHTTGRYYMGSGDLKKASTELDRAFGEDPYNMDIIYSQIELFIHLGDEQGEINWWQELLKRFPESRLKMLQEVCKAFDEQRTPDARKLLKALLARWPQDKDALRLMAEYVREKEDLTDEVAYLRNLLPMARDERDLIIQVGLVLLRKNFHEEARDFLEKGVALKPDEPAAHLGLATIHWHRGNVELCVAELDQVLRLLGKPCKMEITVVEELGAICALIGELLLPNGDIDAAVMAYEMALEMNCHLTHVYQGLGLALKEIGRLKESLDHLQTALRLSPNTSEVLGQMGDVYRLMGNMKAAEFCYHKSQSI
ncbi:MAG: hypothetical protein DRH17_00980 [Deltaproteobacteria bacterium]|nr:MAG: hypothetical protein DRH17_00980 [Deltaproteobacteria bacterium]